MLPDFAEHGLLPAGDYELTFEQIRASVLVVGPRAGAPHWDALWRARLVDNLEVMVHQLWARDLRRRLLRRRQGAPERHRRLLRLRHADARVGAPRARAQPPRPLQGVDLGSALAPPVPRVAQGSAAHVAPLSG